MSDFPSPFFRGMRPVIVPIGLFIKDYLSAIDSRYKRPHASQCLYIFHTGGLMWRNEDANCWLQQRAYIRT